MTNEQNGNLTEKNEEKKLAEYKFVISYDAKDKSLSHHEINAKELGEAILGMNNLIEETAKAIGSSIEKVQLKVTTPVKEGSVEVVFALLADPGVALKVLATLGFAAQGAAIAKAALVEMVQKIGNKKITNIAIDGDSEEAKVTTDDGTFVMDKTVAKLIANKRARESLHKIIQAPLIGKPNAIFKVLDKNELPVWTAQEEEINDYKPLPAGTLEEISIDREKINVSFSQINFDSSKGWRIKNKDHEEYPVTMKDKTFLDKVRQNQQAFKKDDLYEIDLEVTTTSRPTRSTIDRVVVEVTRHWASGDRRQV
ncbi:hypothetical protein KJF94_28125 [Pseudomonas hormoni]|jgi:hypothetical protein|uniref:Uncharacterized protein n=1 Tax=Pseudomonas hormoni TaxID=3093767 RepID=A0ABX8EXG4_9PSED|nr:hypothetical protein [Pseudomonas hormoni]QVW23660.1 hypothetical protein KJF94_28125 [Pseudomonas hormoni]